MNFLSFNWLINKIAADNIKEALQEHARGDLLDVGCGTSQYKDFILTKTKVSKYIGLDHEERTSIDIVDDAYSLSKHGQYDTILCTSVLEHLEEPEEALSEMHRALKDGGTLILTTNFIWHIHEEPRDFYRFTSYGLAYLMEKTGLKIIELYAMTGFWVTFGQEFVYYLQKFNRSIFKPFVFLISISIQILCLGLEKINKDEKYAANYLVVARKKA